MNYKRGQNRDKRHLEIIAEEGSSSQRLANKEDIANQMRQSIDAQLNLVNELSKHL